MGRREQIARAGWVGIGVARAQRIALAVDAAAAAAGAERVRRTLAG